MTKLLTIACIGAWSLQVSAAPLPEPTDEFLYRLKESLVKVNTTTKSGGHGFGTAVAIDKEHAVTNCHVLGNSNGISISKWGTEYPVDSFQADWKHDLCILKVAYADLKPVELGDSSQLNYEQSLISISMPTDSPAPYVAISAIKALYPMDDELVIRSQAAFSIGASGSPVFDYEGRLVGISTFKSPGKNAYYYNVPVNWIKKMLNSPEIALNTPHESPFWDAPEDKRPFFMQIVLPFQNNRWQDVQHIAERWVANEPSSAEAWYYQGEASKALGDASTAIGHFQKALSLHPNHPSTLQSMAQLLDQQGKASEADSIRLTLKEINPDLLEDLDIKID
ncbi:MAG: tetratricopeptide repeat-containing serine protease family protein [Methylophilus sp.]|nr:tetratricopeptide repeat-containing serine protease family protein [Methylophilus sp.]